MGGVPHLKFHVQPEGWDIPMTDPNGAGIHGVPWIPSIYPLYVSIYCIPYMDPSWDIFPP